MLYDISPPITSRLAVWPGDTPPSREVLLELARGDSVTLSTLHATVHLGAHADAPNHYHPSGTDLLARPLERYLGRCEVMQVKAGRNSRVTLDQLPRMVTAPRLLLSTGTYPDPERFNQDFAALAPELVDALHGTGVTLIGIDTPSVDLFDSKELPAHGRCAAHDLAILEGLVLAGVPDGHYELIALPLALAGFDASPVRAVLRSWR